MGVGDTQDYESLADRAAATLRGLDHQRESAGWRGADFTSSIIARGIDNLVLGALGALLFLGVLAAEGPDSTTPAEAQLELRAITLAPVPIPLETAGFIAAVVAFIVAYETFCHAVLRATVGRRMMGIQLSGFGTAMPARVWRVAFRAAVWAFPFTVGILSVGYAFLYAVLGFGLLIAMYGWHRRDPHDRPLWDVFARTHTTMRV